MGDTEEYFPRGGKKPTDTYFRQNNNFLGAPAKAEKRKKKPKKKVEGDDGYLSEEGGGEYNASIKNCNAGIHFQIMKEGLLLLGRVLRIMETKIKISLPGQSTGMVMACHISEAYNKQLEAYVDDKVESVRELTKMFRTGQYVAVKVLEAEPTSLLLSMMPQHVNAGKMHSDLHKGTLLQAAVVSEEDHGYVMDVGIPNIRAFMPKKNANPELELDIGMLTWCTVKSVSPSSDSSVVTLTNRLDCIQEGVCRKPPANTSTILPGTAVEFIVDKPLNNGIEGRIFGKTTAYIQRAYTDTVKGKKPTLGQKIRARLLYELPIKKTPFLTMKSVFETTYPDLDKEQFYKEGDIIEDATVIKIYSRMIIFRLGNECTGVMVVKDLPVEEDLDDEQILAKSYPLGSEHKVRVLRYNLSDYRYAVSDKADVLSECYFSLESLKVGQLVDAEISDVDDNRILLKVGRLTGMVPRAHFTDAGVFVGAKKAAAQSLVKKKFKVGKTVQARVLAIDLENNHLQLTMKPSLLEEDLDVLQSYEDAVVGQVYTGWIQYIRNNYLLVRFFNNVTAYVPENFCSKEPIPNKMEVFHLGQIVKCTILDKNVEAKRMSGSLTTPPFTDPSKRKTNPEFAQKRKQKDTEEIARDEPKPKKSKKETEKEPPKSEESDAIETDIAEEQFLTEDDLKLIDLTNCTNEKKYKKRIAKIENCIKNLKETFDTTDAKIQRLEEKGIDAKNKKKHTKLNSEKFILDERISALTEALKKAKQNQHSPPKEEKESVDVEEIEKSIKQKVKEIKVVSKSTLEVPSVKDFWSEEVSVGAAKEVETSSSDEEDSDQPKKKRKKLTAAEKVAKAREEEERLRKMEKDAIEGANQPRSVEQFERALLANPNCSQLWLAYCAFHLQATEIDKARAVCRKALNTISYREEDEKLNIWLAMINFEHRFGTKESQQKTLEEALQMNDTYKVHSQLLDIFVDLTKTAELTTLVDLMLRKYKRNPQTYNLCGQACYKLGLVDKARQVMQKAIGLLEKKEHVSVLVQFALLEKSHGEQDRAEALFEQILGVYPQRVDVCSVYVDMLLKGGDVDQVRQVLERMTSHKLPARKMKVLYKKWIEAEEKIGDESQIDRIRQKAKEFMENAKF